MKRVAKAVVVLGATGVALAGCGEAAPLESLSDTQRAQLDAAWSARIAATDPAAIPVEERNARVTALYKACGALDGSSPLTGAVSGTCQPTAIGAKLTAVLPERCARPTKSCVRALDRIAQTAEQQGVAAKGLSNAATAAVSDPLCRAQFTQNEVQLKAYTDLAQAYRILATGVEQRDKDISGLGQRRADDARAVLTAPGGVAERTAKFREACGLG